MKKVKTVLPCIMELAIDLVLLVVFWYLLVLAIVNFAEIYARAGETWPVVLVAFSPIFAIFATVEVSEAACKCLLHRRQLLEYSTSKGYPEGFVICSASGQELNTATDRRGKLLVRRYHDCYAVCIGFTYDDLADAATRAHEIFHKVEYQIPRSYLLTDNATCLVRPKMPLRTILQAKASIETGAEKAFFVFYCQRELPHRGRGDEVVIIDRWETTANYQTSA